MSGVWRGAIRVVEDTRHPKPFGTGVCVGIWWATAEKPRIAAVLQAATSVQTRAPLIDSDFEHWKEWSAICHHFDREPRDEYFCVARGRVLVRRTDQHAVVYHGNTLPMAVLKRIARIFRLSTWSPQFDEHYGNDADWLVEE